MAEAQSVLGWGDGTYSFRNSLDVIEKASRYLSQRYSNRLVQLPAADKSLLDAVIKIRNVLAHRSQRGVSEMNVALADSHLPASIRRGSNRSVRRDGIARYLGALQQQPDVPRFHLYFEGLARIAYALAPGGSAQPICAWTGR
jgi:hypothetical protein